jgi:3-oxoacid CoA-transferase subunit B
MPGERLTEEAIAIRAAREFRDGMIINLGAGIPSKCSSYVPHGMEILLHAENGLIGFGDVVTDPALANPNMMNAGGYPVSPKPGMAIVDHTESFAIIRGGHIDITVLGALEVSEKGDLANNKLPEKQIGSYGGAPDLAYNAKRVIVCMTHTTRDGRPKIVKQCATPLTAPECVSLIITDLAVIEVTKDGLVLKEIAPGWTPEEVMAMTEPPLRVSPDLREFSLVD